MVLVGGGGHALVVWDAALRGGMDVAGFLDDGERARLAAPPAELARLGALDAPERGEAWVLCVGDLALRRAWLGRHGGMGARAVIHPGSVVGAGASVGDGVLVGAGAIVQTAARVGAHAIVNTGAIVEHECEVGENAHLAPGSVLGGRVRVGADTLVGLGARVLPGVRIGSGCVVGAGAVVVRDVADGACVIGVPARASR